MNDQLSLPKNRTLTSQQSNLLEDLKETLALALSSQEDVKFSAHTYKSYFKHAASFVLWCEKNHKAKTVEACRCYVESWIQDSVDRGLSAHTIKLQAAALAKLYKCKITDFDVKTPPRTRTATTRSRGEKVRDDHFSEQQNQDLVRFCLCTGLHRAELEQIRGEDIREVDGQYYFAVTKATIGDRARMAPIVGTAGDVAAIVVQARIAGAEKIFNCVTTNADIQGYRIEYAKRVYNLYKRELCEFKNERLIMYQNHIVDTYVSPGGRRDSSKHPDIYLSSPDGGGSLCLKHGWRDVSSAYYCRNDFRKIVFDRLALRKVADAIGLIKEVDVVWTYFGAKEA